MRKSNLIKKRALEINECKDCEIQSDPKIFELDLPKKKKSTSKEYEKDKTYQDKGSDTDLQVDLMGIKDAALNPAQAILNYVRSSKSTLEQILSKKGENALMVKVVNDLSRTIPGASTFNNSGIAGAIVKYLVQAESSANGVKVKFTYNDNQFLQEIQPIIERKQASMKAKIHCPNCDAETTSTKPGKINCPECGYSGPSGEKEKSTKTKMRAAAWLRRLAAEGGVENEEEEGGAEEDQTLDTTVVSLLESCKSEWLNLGEPVNPDTWPKEVERAILELNDAVTKAIDSIQAKLIEGDYYIKNVDEGVDAGGGSEVEGMSDLKTAPPEHEDKPEHHHEELSDPSEEEESEPKVASKKAAVSIDSGDTKKAIRFVDDLQEKVVGIFFEYKKAVEGVNNSALVKSAGEDMVKLKSKLNEINKALGKQFVVLEAAEESVEKKGKSAAKETNQYIKNKPGHKNSKGEPAPWVVLDKSGKIISSHTSKEKAEASFRGMEMGKHSSFMGLNLAPSI